MVRLLQLNFWAYRLNKRKMDHSWAGNFPCSSTLSCRCGSIHKKASLSVHCNDSILHLVGLLCYNSQTVQKQFLPWDGNFQRVCNHDGSLLLHAIHWLRKRCEQEIWSWLYRNCFGILPFYCFGWSSDLLECLRMEREGGWETWEVSSGEDTIKYFSS